MHNIVKGPNILSKSCGVYIARFLKYVWSFYNIMHERVNYRIIWILASLPNVIQYQFLRTQIISFFYRLSSAFLLQKKFTEKFKKITEKHLRYSHCFSKVACLKDLHCRSNPGNLANFFGPAMLWNKYERVDI